MSVIRTREFVELLEMDVFLSGGVIGGLNILGGNATAGGTPGAYGVVGLVGKTFKISQPAPHTVTFVAGVSTDGRLIFSEIKAQIEAVATEVRISVFKGQIVIREITPSTGVTIDHTGTATGQLGFDPTTDTVGTLYGGVGAAAPSFQGAYSTNGNLHVVITLENP